MSGKIIASIKNYFSEWINQPLSLIIVLITFTGVAIKASFVSFTWDEAASYLHFVQYKIWLPNQTHFIDANNHILNTFFMILEDQYFAKSIFSLRIHSLFSFLLYAAAAFSLSKGLLQNKNVLLFMCILILHPYLLDFFSLARGYAMSLAFEMLAIALLFIYIHNSSKFFPLLIMLCSCLATLSNFTLLNFQLAIFAVTNLFAFHLFYKKQWSKQKLIAALLPGWILSGIFFKLILTYLFKLKENGNLYFGGNDGFWQNTVNSLVHALNYNAVWPQLIKGIFILIFISTFMLTPVWLILKYKNKKEVLWQKILAVFMLLVIIILSTILQHLVFQTPYLMERTSLLFLPLILTLVASLLAASKAKITLRLVAIFFTIHLILNINFNSVFEWKFNAFNHMAYEFISKLPSPEERSQINFCAAFEYSPVIKFYTTYFQNKSIAPIKTEINYFDPQCDYFMYNNNEKNKLNLPPVKEIFKHKNADFVIAKKLHPFSNKCVDTHLMTINYVTLPFNNLVIKKDRLWTLNPQKEYSQTFNIIFDSTLINKNSFIEINVLLKTNKPLTDEIGLFYKVYRNNESLDYKYCELYHILNHKINRWVPVKFTFPLPQNLKPGDQLASFVYNNFKQTIAYKQFHITIFHYKNP
jgi:hypothetical protein